jgi:hypothetical protein
VLNPDVNIDLKGAGLCVFRVLGEGKVRAVLVACELMFALALLAASGLLIRSLVLLSNVDPEFDATNLLTVSTALPESKYAQPEQRVAFFGRVLRRIVRWKEGNAYAPELPDRVSPIGSLPPDVVARKPTGVAPRLSGELRWVS